jgi:hypothetical protein
MALEGEGGLSHGGGLRGGKQGIGRQLDGQSASAGGGLVRLNEEQYEK